jgi:endonuclease/exonuclease/phosphatase family metal-dependent hydrolase
MAQQTLKITTYNIHKGFSPLGRRLTVHALRDSLQSITPDIMLLQEVQGQHRHHEKNHHNWPAQSQHEFLADADWHAAYGHNMVYDHGHHGNAILSRHPMSNCHNQDVTHLWFEKRGLLHGTVAVPGLMQPLHCVCVHLSLFAASRRLQMASLAEKLDKLIPTDSPLIIAGDFNDWRNQADRHLAQRLGLEEVFAGHHGEPARSFPSILPLFRMDRIYVRGLRVLATEVHRGQPWATISDHAPLSVLLALPLTE